MYSSKVHSIFHNLEKQSCDICGEVDAFMGSILEWADELLGIVEKEFTEGKESAVFLLPKTPSEKKTRGRKARNAGVSKCSVINSTFLQNETTTNLDDSVSLRTRGAKRAATSKMSQLNIPKDAYETVQETLIIEANTKEDVSETTFVMHKANTRTKPVLKNKQPEATVPEPKSPGLQQNEIPVLISSGENLDKESPPKKMSKTRENLPEQLSKSKISRIPNGSLVGRLSRRKKSRTLSGSPTERPSARKVFRSLSGSPVIRSSVLLRSPSKSPKVRSNSVKRARVTLSPATQFTRIKSKISTSQDPKASTSETLSSVSNRTITIKKEFMLLTPTASSTFFTTDETCGSTINDEEKTPVVKLDRFFRLSKTSTPAIDVEGKTPLANVHNMQNEINENLSIDTRAEIVTENNTNAPVFINVENITEEAAKEAEIPKKKRKLKKGEEVKENVQEMEDTVRITRTKSKAIEQMMEENETKQTDLSAFAKKLLNRAKMTSIKKNQLAALLESDPYTPTNGPGKFTNNLPFGNLTTSKSKYHLLLNSSKKLKTSLAALPNSAMKIVKGSEDKNRPKLANRDSSVENVIRSATKLLKNGLQEGEIKLKSKKEKEEEAALKRQNVIKRKQEELKRKNELKHQMAMKQREKLEQEKYHNMIQLEKEKEERHKLILQERQMKLKEETFKKKMLTQQKIAENVERRRIEEEARIAKLKEMEAEEQRLALEKQKEQERQEKRAQERLAQKKAREEYEMQLKQELEVEKLRAEKQLTAKKCAPSTSKLQSASKRQKFGIIGEKREWDYKSRNENDYGLEDEHSEVDSENEESYDKAKPPMPWSKKVMHGKSPVVKILTLEMLCEFIPCYQKSPDIYKMFKMTPSKRFKRSSSAIWNTPSS